MATELFVVSMVSASGALLVTSLDPLARWHRIAFAGPILGYAGLVLLSLPLVALHSFTLWTGVLGLFGTALIVLWFRREDIAVSLEVSSGISSAVVLTLLVIAGSYILHITRLTPDSGTYLIVSGWLEQTGGMDNVSDTALLKRQLGTPLLHVVGQGPGPGYAVGWTALLGASSLGLIVASSWSYLSRIGVAKHHLVILETSAVLLLLTTNRVLYNFAYINGHMIFASLLLVGVLFAWLRSGENGFGGLLLAGVAMAALIPLRAEAFIVVAFFAVPTIHSTRRTPTRAWTLVAPVVYATLVWYGLTIYPSTGPAIEVIGPFIVALGLTVHLLLTRYLGPAWSTVGIITVPVALVGYLIFSGLSDLPMLGDTFKAFGTNIFWKGRWGLFWIVVPILVASVFVTRRVKRDLIFYYGLSTFVLAVVAFAFLRDGAYRVSQSDSGNRMLMHVVFVAVLYAVIGVGSSLRQSTTSFTPGTTTEKSTQK